MARRSKSAAIDYSKAHELTPDLIDYAACPPESRFVVLKDADKKGLRLRVTQAGGKHWQFETRLRNAKLFTRALGEWPTVSIKDARAEAHRLRGLTEQGQDPREHERQQQAAQAADKAAAAAHAVTVGEVWTEYLAERRPHWGELHYQDHVNKAAPGGEPFKRGKGITQAGPLFPLLAIPLRDLDAPTIEAWAAREATTRPTSARLAWRLLKVFLGWCEEQPAYAGLLPAKNPAKTKKARESLGRAGVKQDALQREQLTVWFDAVRKISNPVTAAYLQTLLLTGARPGEVLGLRWEDVNTKWKGLTIRDKVEGERVIPLTPYVSQLLAALPRRNEWVFSSPNTDTPMSKPHKPHDIACKVAAIDGLTLHGLRRSFKSLTEWLEVPVGVVAQVMGHKPSATAEKHYTVRPLDLLRVHHEKIETWILEQAGVPFVAGVEPGKLALVAG